LALLRKWGPIRRSIWSQRAVLRGKGEGEEKAKEKKKENQQKEVMSKKGWRGLEPERGGVEGEVRGGDRLPHS